VANQTSRMLEIQDEENGQNWTCQNANPAAQQQSEGCVERVAQLLQQTPLEKHGELPLPTAEKFGIQIGILLLSGWVEHRAST
jgi:hypothetical protein